MSKHSSTGAEWRRVRQAVLERDGHLCVYCRERQATEVDHVVPKSRGGTDDPSNLVACCGPCNKAKSDKSITRTTWRHPRWFPGVKA